MNKMSLSALAERVGFWGIIPVGLSWMPFSCAWYQQPLVFYLLLIDWTYFSLFAIGASVSTTRAYWLALVNSMALPSTQAFSFFLLPSLSENLAVHLHWTVLWGLSIMVPSEKISGTIRLWLFFPFVDCTPALKNIYKETTIMWTKKVLVLPQY